MDYDNRYLLLLAQWLPQLSVFFYNLRMYNYKIQGNYVSLYKDTV